MCWQVCLFLNILWIIYICNIIIKGNAAIDVDWLQIPSPPVFYHGGNDRIMYYTVDSKTINPEHQRFLKELKERTLKCAARGNPPPQYVFK